MSGCQRCAHWKNMVCGNFDDDKAEEGEEDSGSGEADLGGGAEEDMGDSGDLNNSGSF